MGSHILLLLEGTLYILQCKIATRRFDKRLCTKSWPEDEQLVLQSTSLMGPSSTPSSTLFSDDGWLSDDQGFVVWAEVMVAAPITSAHCFWSSHVFKTQVFISHLTFITRRYILIAAELRFVFVTNCLLDFFFLTER